MREMSFDTRPGAGRARVISGDAKGREEGRGAEEKRKRPTHTREIELLRCCSFHLPPREMGEFRFVYLEVEGRKKLATQTITTHMAGWLAGWLAGRTDRQTDRRGVS